MVCTRRRDDKCLAAYMPCSTGRAAPEKGLGRGVLTAGSSQANLQLLVTYSLQPILTHNGGCQAFSWQQCAYLTRQGRGILAWGSWLSKLAAACSRSRTLNIQCESPEAQRAAWGPHLHHMGRRADSQLHSP